METFIKEKGLASIRAFSKEALEARIKAVSLEANEHLINAAYAESLIASVDEQINQYELLIAATATRIADIEEQATHAVSAQEGYNIRKEKKPLEATMRQYQQGKERMMERKATAIEKIHAHRFDAQATMHRLEYMIALTPEVLVGTLETHIKNQEPKVAEEEAKAIIAEEAAQEVTPEETETEAKG